MSEHTTEKDTGPFCIAAEPSTDALCHLAPGHGGPHNGWAHFPGQMMTWPNTPTPPDSGASA